MEPKHLSVDENNIPQNQFGGLTVHQVYALVNKPLSQESPLRINPQLPGYVLDQLPFFRSCEHFLSMINQSEGLKLSSSGGLAKQHLIELYKKSIAKHPDLGIESSSSRKIGEWNFLDSVCQVCLVAGLFRVTGNRLILTKKGQLLINPAKRVKLFETLLKAFGDKFNWAYNDGYTEAGVGQVGWAYTIFMIMQYGEKPREARFYADKYFRAFPAMLEYFEDEYIPVEEESNDCYKLRALIRFAAWWGFINELDTDFMVPQVRSTRTTHDYLYDLFILDELIVNVPGTGTYD